MIVDIKLERRPSRIFLSTSRSSIIGNDATQLLTTKRRFNLRQSSQMLRDFLSGKVLIDHIISAGVITKVQD